MKLFNYFTVILVFITVFSCAEKSNEQNLPSSINTDTITYSSFDNTSFREVQFFEINTNNENHIIGDKGTKVTIPKDCFGKIKGSVKIELIECYSIQDMLFNKLTTVTEKGEILASDGMIYLNAVSESGDTLEIASKKTIKVQMPTKKLDKEMKLFEGEQHSNLISWNLSKNKINFMVNSDEERDTFVVIETETSDSINYGAIKYGETKGGEVVDKIKANSILSSYIFNLTKLGWINCDKYLNEETKDLIVNVGENTNRVQFYLVYNGAVSIIPCSVIDSTTVQFKSVPKGSSSIILALAIKNENLFFNSKLFESTTNSINFPKLNEITREELKEFFVEKFGNDIWSRPNI